MILKKKKLIISGPCSVETEKQFQRTTKELIDIGKIDVIRGGVWKPRTRPGTFEGVGEPALKWLTNVKHDFKIPIAIEIANRKQVELALKNDIDILWIGARTTVNPFSVQEIADTLRGVDIPILIKNPINPDIDLWSGALERISKAGINEIGLVHRGFASYNNYGFRNPPMWHLALDMKYRYSEIPMICDPSHICGKRDNILAISQYALNLDYDGLMIESHFDPRNAWSDSKQQLKPNDLNILLDKLNWRKRKSIISGMNLKIDSLRDEISEIDSEIIKLISKRIEIVKNIGKFKNKINYPIIQYEHWKKNSEIILKIGRDLGISEEFLFKYMKALHIESISNQNDQ